MKRFKNTKNHYKINGQKGGRPQQDSSVRIELPEVNLVILTPKQYNSLLEKYGTELLIKALKILDNWFLSGSPIAGKYVGKNNYAHFRSDGWLINEAARSLGFHL